MSHASCCSRIEGKLNPYYSTELQNAMRLLTFAAVCAAISASQSEANTATGPFLPPLLLFNNGSAVASVAAWATRKAEVASLLQTTILGTLPATAPPLVAHSILNTTSAGDGVACTFVSVTFDTAGGGVAKTVEFVIEVIHATDTTAGARPMFMTQWNHRPWAQYAVSRGYVGVLYPGSDAKDVAPAFQAAYPKATMALIMARAFVGSRTLDYMIAHWPNVLPSQVAVTGHSRNGKQSLVFAAFDARVAAVVGSSPGAPIAAPYRFTTSNFYGEGPPPLLPQQCAVTFPHPARAVALTAVTAVKHATASVAAVESGVIWWWCLLPCGL